MSEADINLVLSSASASLKKFKDKISSRLLDCDRKEALEQTLKSSYKLFVKEISELIIKQRLLTLVLFARRSCTKRIALPSEIVGLVVDFVGDGLNMNPMTGALASALTTPLTLWNDFEKVMLKGWSEERQRKLVSLMLGEITIWWNGSGGEIVSNAVHARSNSYTFNCNSATFPCMFNLLRSVFHCNFLGEETNVPKLLDTHFKSLGFCGVTVSFQGKGKGKGKEPLEWSGSSEEFSRLVYRTFSNINHDVKLIPARFTVVLQLR